MKMRFGILFVGVLSIMMMSLTPSTVSTGIEFEHMTLEQAKVLSKKSGKLIFIDCYTDWCGPCKRMAATSFKNEQVAKVYNEKFINLKIEMEKNPEGPELARRYQVRAYPTLLIINSKGELIEKRVGMQNADGLLILARSTSK